MFLKEELGGHGKDHRVIQKVLPLEHIFKIGDRITAISESLGFGRFGIVGTIKDVIFDKRKKITWLYILWDDGKSDRHVAGAKTLKIVEENLLEHKKQCDILIYSRESEALRLPQKLSEGYALSNLSRSIQMPKPSCDRTTQVFPSIVTSETIPVQKESSILSPQDSLVPTHLLQETEQESKESLVHSGLKPCELLENATQLSLLSKTPQDYSVEEWERSCKAYPKAGTMRSGKLSVLPKLEQPIKEKGFLSLPTPNASSKANSRAAGQTKCEIWFRDNGLLQGSQCLSPQMMAQLLGFPMDWTKCLWESKEVLEEELEADSYLDEPLCQPVQPSLLDELNISTIIEEINLDISDSDRQWIDLYDRLARLESERNQIRSTGPVAICGVWIEYGKVAKRKFRQAYYRSTKAIFPAKRQSSFAKSESGLVKRSYIGEENSKEVKAAGEAIARRNRLMAIAKEIKQIEEKLIE